jgi:hypothetical protein
MQYQFLCNFENSYDYLLNSKFIELAASFLAYNQVKSPKYVIPIPM